MNTGENNSRVHDKSNKEVRSNQYGKKLYITEESSDAGSSYGISDKAHDAEGSAVDDPGDYFRNRFGNIIEACLCRAACAALHCNAEDDGPCQDPDVVRIHDGSDRVIDDRKDQVVKDLDNAAWRSQLCFRSHLQNQRSREKEGHPDTNKRSTECADCVKNDDRLHAAFCIFLALCHGVHDKEENENRRNAFQCFDEEVAQNGYGRNGSRRKDGDENADDKADGDLLDECHS